MCKALRILICKQCKYLQWCIPDLQLNPFNSQANSTINPPNYYSRPAHLSPWGEILMLILWLGKCALSLCFIRLKTAIWHVIGEGIWFITATLHFLAVAWLISSSTYNYQMTSSFIQADDTISDVCNLYTNIMSLSRFVAYRSYLKDLQF